MEIEQAAGLSMPRELPVIALCDSGGQTNWVSQKFVDDLSKSNPVALKPFGRLRRRKSGEISHIYIRWTCRKLELYSQGGFFYIQPKANFKILFGCKHNTADLSTRSWSSPSPYNRIKEQKQQEEDPRLSNTTIDSFRRGIQDGILLQLRRMPLFPDDGASYLTVAELENELNYVFGSYSTTDDALKSASTDEVALYPYSALNLVEVESSQGSIITESENPSCTASTNTSMSEELCRGRPLSERLRGERFQSRQQWGLEGWFDQGICEEPQPWIPRMVQPRQNRATFAQCHDLNLSQRNSLAAARAEAERITADYWHWDEEVQNYKHYDEGSLEPVWYNPP